ncbi:MAG: hypothetical protein QNJ11_17260, partial [Woeseiaceae bacterium]|nr:hypothetical protein [Woeseiaceae bacterium]
MLDTEHLEYLLIVAVLNTRVDQQRLFYRRRNDAVVEFLYQPSLNIDGIWGGYTGEGVKTILP